jgi:hypothetical protein
VVCVAEPPDRLGGSVDRLARDVEYSVDVEENCGQLHHLLQQPRAICREEITTLRRNQDA